MKESRPGILSSVLSGVSWVVEHLLLYGFFKGKPIPEPEPVSDIKTPVVSSMRTGSDLIDSPKKPKGRRGSGGGNL